MAEERVRRRLSAILAADVAGYSRLVRADEEGTLAALKDLRAGILEPSIARHDGRVVKLMGDGVLVEFPSVVDAVRVALDIQNALAERNSDLSRERRMEFRIGVNLGDVVIDGDDIQGDGVNVASRLEGLAEPGGICVSGAVYDQVRDRIDLDFEDLGDQEVKNIDRPVRTWRWKPAVPDSATRDDEPRLPLPEKPSIAVLPFDNLSGDPEQDYFADGITEDIITALSRFRWLFVIARNSSFTYKGKPVDVRTVGCQPGVRYVLEGSMRKSGDRLRISAQLIEAATGNHLWAEKYDREVSDVFALQDDIAVSVVGAMQPEIESAELERARIKPPDRLDAWDLFLRGKAQYHLYARENLTEAVSLLTRAIELDPEFASAHGALAHALHLQLIFDYADDAEAVGKQARRAAETAVRLERDDADIQVALGAFRWTVGEIEDACSALERAIELNPSSAIAHSLLGAALGMGGRAEEGLDHHRIAIRLSPRDPSLAIMMGRFSNTCNAARRYEEAVEIAQKAIRLSNGRIWHNFINSIVALGHLGKAEEARMQIRRMAALHPNVTIDTVRRAYRFMRPDYVEHYVDGLRKAGLPEQ